MKEKKEPQTLDLLSAEKGLTGIKLDEGRHQTLIVTYHTGAKLEAQKVWMMNKLKFLNWYQQLEEQYHAKIIQINFKCRQTYSLVLELGYAGFLDLKAISDEVFRSDLINFIRRNFAMRIIEEFPLPFEAEAFWGIPAAANAMCKYVFTQYGEEPVIDENIIKVIENPGFKKEIKTVIEENDGVFVNLRVERAREEKYFVGYLEYKRKDEHGFDLFTPDPLSKALRMIMYKFLKDNNSCRLEPWGEEDIT